MFIPSPGAYFADLSPNRPSGRFLGQETHLTIDIGSGANTLAELVYELPNRSNAGHHAFSSASILDQAGTYIPFVGAGTVTIAYLGPRIPFILRATIDGSETDYDMGPSNTSQVINVAGGETLELLQAIRRF